MTKHLLVVSLGVNVVLYMAYKNQFQKCDRVAEQHLQLAYRVNSFLLDRGIDPPEFTLKALRDFGIREENHG